MPETRSDAPLVWIDCEMTGLSAESDTIMSIACFVTDAQLRLLEPAGFEAVIAHSRAQLDAMGEWCRAHHGASGLTAACLAPTAVTAEAAAAALLQYVQRYAPQPRHALLAGNSVHADRAFLARAPWAPLLQHLSYRLLDVSAIKEAARRWAPDGVLALTPAKAGKHEARADILESIEEARFYKNAFFQR